MPKIYFGNLYFATFSSPTGPSFHNINYGEQYEYHSNERCIIVPKIVTLDQLSRMASPQMKIIDLREPQAFNQSHRPDAINIPYDKLLLCPEKYLNETDAYYLLCDNGSVSYRAAYILEIQGYNTASIRSGYSSPGTCPFANHGR